MNISLRAIVDQDLEFLYQVYASTRQDELAVTGWDDEQQESFLRMQFNAQHMYYQQHYADACFDVIEADQEPIGRLYVQRRDVEHRVVDIALLPQHRGKGIGDKIMRDILGDANAASVPVRIHVETSNPALHWYQRLGFQMIDETGVYYLMERPPD